ncbi:glycoside hydrolase family 3 protein [Legionella bononiensis]|uniref:beta-N-acetylhexosaminidase n=1 Tax=Legionella bononiensis TaxID=2793102 RepID=A0ABS1WBV7_9GAMM|nr:glycoside hydrolase family 3 N-terminal domain-containing protein [Legionella bononiensis]MBL7481127.1 glycoside hydrolase family 3 protein [Legionella bononiensis]MBL7526836.1 glycoside hydrolase family 3 protein [Legionella bononiensis]MBL7564243.1 glycoside hydrolase family 3 protein [Legionella bononiensis]
MIIYRIILTVVLAVFSSYFYAAEPTLRDKIGQMLILGFQGKEINEHSPIAVSIVQNNIGGVILFDFNQQSQKFDKNIENPEQLKKLDQQLQEITKKANKLHHREHLPLFISIDYEGGNVIRLSPAYGFPAIPSAKTVGTLSKVEAKSIAKLMAVTMQTAGINLDFFPDLDVDINPDNLIISKKERSFSSDPEVVSQYASVVTEQFLNNHIQCAYKHFPGHGSSVGDSHLGFVDVTDTWTAQELIPFAKQLRQPRHCGMVMIAHIVNRKLDAKGLPASLSFDIITGLLRHDLKFDGVVITDDLQMKAISNYYGLPKALTLSINAGADMVIFGNQLVQKFQDPEEIIDIIEQKVLSGEISEQRINEAYQRIVRMKKSLGK